MASRTPSQISADILAKLATTAPGLSLEVGTPERKIIDAVGESISEVQVDNYINSTALDIDTKSGTDLEDYVGVFGYGRLQGNYATGEVVVTFNQSAVQSYTIPAGTQFTVPPTSTQSAITFNSTSTVAFNVGDNSAVIPLQCAIVGSIGNVNAGSVTGFVSGQSFSTVTNIAPFQNGTDDETDEELRARFKKTILRNIAGTEDFYIAICLQVAANGNTSSSGVTRVNVLGPVSRYVTQIQTLAQNVPVTVPSKNCKFIWPSGESVSENSGQPSIILPTVVTINGSTAITGPSNTFQYYMVGSFVSGTGIPDATTISAVNSDTSATLSAAATASGSIDFTVAGETWYTGNSDYTVTSGNITNMVITPLTPATSNSFLDVVFEYNSTNSRNDPNSGIANKIDIFVDGSNPQAVSEVIVASNNAINNIQNSAYYYGNFTPYNGSYAGSLNFKVFQRLGSTPIISWPSSIFLGSTQKFLGVDYLGVYDATTRQGSEREVAGIAWITTPPANGTTFIANYTYNQTPQILNSIFKKQKQITSDPLVHQANVEQFGFTFVIQYNQGYAPNNVNNDVISALTTYFNTLPFGAWVQLSDILQTTHNVNGVDNVRMAKTGDGIATGGLYLWMNGSVQTVYTSDFQLADNTLAGLYVPLLGDGSPNYASMFIRRSFNNFN